MGMVLHYVNITSGLPPQWLSSDCTACKYKIGFFSLFLYHHFNSHVRYVRDWNSCSCREKKVYP
jgi:hypothetical protein